MAELQGKGLRVLGYFLWMLGAGVVLDSEAVWSGSALLACGFLLFAVGVFQSLRRRPRAPR